MDGFGDKDGAADTDSPSDATFDGAADSDGRDDLDEGAPDWEDGWLEGYAITTMKTNLVRITST
eukprot:scaffold1474_cov23-Cyclotella_meneghiniana.AAC.1